MIVDHRTYELQAGRLLDCRALCEKEALPVQKKHLGNPVGFFTTKVGNVDEVVQASRCDGSRSRGGLICRRAENN